MKRAFLSLDAILSSKKDDIAFFFFQFVSLRLTLSKSSPLLTDSKKRACCILRQFGESGAFMWFELSRCKQVCNSLTLSLNSCFDG